MPGLVLMDPPPPPPVVEEYDPGFVVSHQKLEIEVDFANQAIIGRTEITILPRQRDLKEIRFNARQCEITKNGVTVNGRDAVISYENPYNRVDVPKYVRWTAEQYDIQRDKIKPLLQAKRTPGELIITLPRGVRIEDVNPFSEQAPIAVRERALGAVRTTSVASVSASTPLLTPKTAEDQSLRFSALTVTINFTTKHFRDGIHWVGLEEGDSRYPHMYTRHSIFPGIACCIFPCLDDPTMRCTWEIIVKCSRTLGDAVKRKRSQTHAGKKDHVHFKVNGTNGHSGHDHIEDAVELSSEDKLLELNVICSGELTDETVDPRDNSKKIVSFLCTTQVAPQHIGFSVGPFEQVDLSEFREAEENDKLGQKAVKVYGYCLPGRVDEVRNTCEALAYAVDWFSLTFSLYPFPDYKLCFIDDQITDTVPLAAFSLCSTRLLFPESIIDPEVEATRQLIHTLASQWIGVAITPSSCSDIWVVVGLSHFITDLCMQTLCGNNEYRFRQKTLADRLVDLDIQRPSLFSLGETLHLGQFEMDFMVLKAPLVLFILDRRLIKLSGSTGLARIIGKICYTASTGEQLSDKTISTENFRRLCEKFGHCKLETFFAQWVLGAGCPRFMITQKFNKKRLTVEMTIRQTQDTLPTQRKLEKEAFQREFREETGGIYAGDVQSFFTGPMTIRIHEADGTPYEHIVEIREGVQKIEIPYHTKYKRLKRSRRERERATVGAGTSLTTENQDDVLFYCLGDTLQSPEEVKEWGLVDWDPEMEMKMEQESYEWIRMDADFEWICELIMNMPPYMYVSQLQQDRDVVAQQDSMLFLTRAQAHPLVSTFLIRTLMDERYFHGIREMAAKALSVHATQGYNWIGRIHLEKAFHQLFCYPGTNMPRSNDFSDKSAYRIKCAIPKSMALIRNNDGKCPIEARQFILDQLRFNDNGNNDYSDYYYVCSLLDALADSLIPKKNDDGTSMSFSFEEEDEDELQHFQQVASEEIERYRRMDEWILSYHNIYTTTALGCKQRLIKAKVILPKPADFFAYTHDGTLDLVRIKAFEALIDLGYITNDSLVRYFLKIMSTDASPFFRTQCHQILFSGLASIALAENKQPDPAPQPEDGLIIEQDASLEAKKEMIARTTTIVGALNALKEDMRHNHTFKDAIWDAVTSSDISLWEQEDFLAICSIICDPIESQTISLKLPRYWAAVNRGKGIVQFRKTNRVRLRQMPKSTITVSKPASVLAVNMMAIPSVASSNGTMKPPKRPSPSGRKESLTSERPSKIIKLSVGDKLRNFPHATPSPSLPQGSSITIASPGVSLSGNELSPAPKIRVPLPGAARVPLPDSMPSPPVASTLKRPSLKLKLSFGPKKP